MLEEKNNIWLSILSLCLRTIVNLFIVFILFETLVYAYNFSYQLFADLPYMAGQTQPIAITIEEGETATQIAEILYENKIVENKYIFLIRAYIGKYTNRLVAGEYTVNSTMTPDEICKMLCGIKNEETS